MTSPSDLVGVALFAAAVATVIQGDGLEPVILDFLARPGVAYLHAHYAGPGCYAALIERG